MNLTTISLRFRWLQLPTGILVTLLQRTPAPVVRALAQVELFVANQSTALLRSGVVAAAMGAYNSVAGATVFNVTPATPSSGPANSTFTVTGTAGTGMSVSFSVSGAPGNPKSWNVKSTTPLPAGLSVVGGNPVNVVAPYKMTISGTPAAAGSTSCTVTAWDGLNATGNSAKITVVFNIAGGAVAVAPTITTQPSSQTVTAGGSVTFAVAANGSPTPTFQWQKDGASVAGATSASLSLSNVQAADAGTYTAVATNSAGSATSSGAVLTVQAAPPAAVAPAITTQPLSQSVTVGTAVTFTGAASGSPAPTFQWQKDGANLAGATSSTLTLGSVQLGDAGSYVLVATNSAGSASSSPATLGVQPLTVAPSFTSQPASQTATVGGTVNFSAAASGVPAPTYQWRKDGADLPGATGATLTLGSVQNSDAGSYTVVASNSAGSVTSSAATLTVQAAPPVNTPPSITAQPSSQSAVAGNSVTFSVGASGNPAPAFQWQFNGAAITGATGSTLTLASVQAADAGSYRVVVTNSAGSVTSNAATLAVQAATVAPSISSQPTSQTVTTGASVTFSVAASGVPSPAYLWLKDGTAIPGATGSSFTIASAGAADAGSYAVQVTNSAGSVTSAVATLTVNAPAAGGPTISTSLGAQSVATGHGASFTAQAIPGASYQWQISTDGGSSWANVTNNATYSGATSPTLAVTGASQGMNGYLYRYVATTSGGSAASNAALLTVTTPLLPNPAAITLAAGGYLILADTTSNLVQRVTLNGEVSTLAGASGSAGATDGVGPGALFNQPAGVVVASSGNIYVADSANATIRRVGTDNTVVTWVGSASARGNADGTGSQASFGSPQGLALDAAGNLYVADANNHTIRRVSPGGVVTTIAGAAGQAGSSDGNGPAARFNSPSAVAVDAAGNVYVADRGNNTLRRITPAGDVTTLAGLAGVSGTDDGTGGAALFSQPTGLAIDSAGNLYVADMGNNAIRRVSPSGSVTTLAGLPTIAGFLDGTGLGAQFSQPHSLTVDGTGNLYVADSGNAAIRKVTPGGTVTTLSLQAAANSPPPSGGNGGSVSIGGTTSSGPGTVTAGAAPKENGAGAMDGGLVGALALLATLAFGRRARGTIHSS
ncbi:MAG: immunoglobulin domain-containing protein [Verrucomicrobia bacterium]|nr:immunoglobulin domain-containing protein [Verrucomicrobiota bacterium]